MIDINESKRALLTHYEGELRELAAIVTRLRRELGVATDANGVTEAEVEIGKKPRVLHEPGGLTDPMILVKPGDFYGMPQTVGTRAYMERTNKQTVTLPEIGAALFRGKAIDKPIEGIAGLRNLSSMLSRSDDFVNVARGRWGLA